jgi:xanthine dehydrogenase accessory factor
MMHWTDALQELDNSGEPYVLLTQLGARGSTPRENGAKMLVSEDRCECSIGGGHLEYQAVEIARQMLASGEAGQRIEKFPLGARLGQCCGGSTSVLFESFPGSKVNIMLFGAGHVGKALATILGQLPIRVRWVDSRENEFPQHLPANCCRIISDSPAHEVASMPAGSYYIIMTHNHPLDFSITEAAIKRGDARYIGLIGSQTKWRRFCMRFDHRGYEPELYQPVRCPVGLAQVPGKLPMEVATSIAAEVISEYQRERGTRPTQRGIGWSELKSGFAGDRETLP